MRNTESSHKRHLVALSALLLAIACSPAQANDAGWPRTLNDGQNEIIVYQPQPDSLNGNSLQARVAVSVKRPGDAQPIFGALWVSAALSTDRDRDIAELRSVRVLRTRFSELSDNEVKSLTDHLESTVPLWDLSISLSHIRAALQPSTPANDSGYRNDPPKILVENRPAILVLLDGTPRLQDTDSKGFQALANTALPVFFESASGNYWLYGSSVWFTTKDLLRGDWKASDSAPAALLSMVKNSDSTPSTPVEGQKAASAEELRKAKIIVATEPTELIVVQGTANYAAISGGDLLYVTNTESDLFLEVATQRNFLQISGRWYAAPSLRGPWAFIAPNLLPKSFSTIPEASPKSSVLAFVPGTDRAKDALMDNIIPQTAQISRKDANLQVSYDGAPKFKDITGTSLSYAVNTPSQIIRAAGQYFACDDGVWYVASAPNGPWTVSSTRPVGIDSIPASSPVYNTKYVYIYDSTPDYVNVGYLPGYRWSLPYQGVVVYGTGWTYNGWYGTMYYPPPVTWGFAVRYNSWSGWSFGMSWSSGWWGMSSGWGPAWRGGWSGGWAGGWAGGWGRSYPGYGPRHYAGGWFGPGGGNIYNRPGRAWVHSQPVSPGRPGGFPAMRHDPMRPNNVFADHDGIIHRNGAEGGWEQRQNRDWHSMQPEPRRAPEPSMREGIGAGPRAWGMEGERNMRERGAMLAGPRGFGGGFGGGFGRRR